MKHTTTLTSMLATAALLAFSGCGLPSADTGISTDGFSDSGSASGGSSGSDSLKITQQGKGFTLVWNKKSSGYSEVGLDSGYVGDGKRAGKLVVSDNYTGRHTLNCMIDAYGSSYVSVGCYGEGPDVLGGTREIEQHFTVSDATAYRFYQTYGALSSQRHSKDSGYRLRYSSGTLNITKP